MFWSTLLLLSLFKLGHARDVDYPDIEKLFSITSDSHEVMETARQSRVVESNLSLNLENIQSVLARDNRSTDTDNTYYYYNLKKLQGAIEDTRKSGAVVENFAFDMDRLDINRIQKKLQDLESALNNEIPLNDTRKQILYPPEPTSILGYYGRPYKWRENQEFSDASQYIMKTKIMDMMLQLIFMARHKIKFLEKTDEFTQVDTSFRIAFVYSKMTLIRRKLWRILSTTKLKNDEVKERKKDPFDYVEVYLILHHKALKLYVDFVYLYELVIKIHTTHQDKHGVTFGHTIPEYYTATTKKTSKKKGIR